MIQVLEARGKIFNNFRIGEAFLGKLYRKRLIDVDSETIKNIRHHTEVKIFKIMGKNIFLVYLMKYQDIEKLYQSTTKNDNLMKKRSNKWLKNI